MRKVWPLRRERTINRQTENNTILNSNNINRNVGGDETSVTLNLQNIFNVAGLAGNVSNEVGESSSGLPIQSIGISSPNPSSATTSDNNAQDKGPHNATSAIPLQPIASNSEPKVPPVSARHTMTDLTGRGRLSSSDSVGRSLFSESEYPVPKEIKPENIRRHLPKNTEEYIQAYMSSPDLFGSKLMIPLWKPSPSNEGDARTWRHHIYLGDVGIFNAAGGFDTLFNIFDSTTRNHERGYEPPSDFIPYPKSLEEMNLEFERAKLPSAKGTKMVGFKAVSQPTQSRSSVTNPSYQANASYCSAICLRAGFLKVSLKQWEVPRILEYIRDHQESWQRHVEETSGSHFSDRPLVVVLATWRTQSCALVTGSRPWPHKCQGVITLRDSVEGGHTHYEWEVAGDNHIFTQFGPSPQLVENQASYFRAMDTAASPKYSPAARKEMEECHCVAVGVFGLRKRGWIRGGSVKSGKSSKTTIRPIWARMMSLPTQLDSSIQEEVEY